MEWKSHQLERRNMRIATYNVWNENKGRGDRFDQLIHEITAVDADIIGLQEVTAHFYKTYLTAITQYPYTLYHAYSNEDEGLAISSKYPFTESCFLHTAKEHANSNALNVLLEVGTSRFSFTNVHLPWDSAKAKEKQIIAIDAFIHEQHKQKAADYYLLVGDFNGDLNASVHRFLVGDQTLQDAESNPYWQELSSSYAALHNLPLQPTLDFVNNPRWQGKNTVYIPCAIDRIYLMDNWTPRSLQFAGIFATAVSSKNNLAASDHYGVLADLDIPQS